MSLIGDRSTQGKGLINPQTLQLLRLQDKIDQSDRIKNLGLIQQKADAYAAQRNVLQLGGRDKKFKNDDSEFTPSKKAEIHVHEYPTANKKIKGHLNLGGTHIKVNSYFSALDALKTLQANPEAPGFAEMECILKGWLDEFSPSNESATEDEPVKKKHEDHDGETKAAGEG